MADKPSINSHPKAGSSTQSILRHTHWHELHDLVCVGFGPASLAIAVALHDAFSAANGTPTAPVGREPPKVAFLERQSQFAWHAGMLVPGAMMQISFIKDMATLRNPKSDFTYLNYLYQQNRLVQFSNLGTFLPLRLEYEDYMRWCAGWFTQVVSYNEEALDVTPEELQHGHSERSSFLVRSRNSTTGEVKTYRTRHVVIAVGGKPFLPRPLPPSHARVIHSSRYTRAIPRLLGDANQAYRIAVIGGGQSAAELFNDLHSRYPNAKTTLLIRDAALRPSDDSPLYESHFPFQTESFPKTK